MSAGIYTLDQFANLLRGNSQLFLIDTRVIGGTPASLSVPGAEYTLPLASVLGPVREILTYDRQGGLSNVGGGGALIPSKTDIDDFTLTLREHDGTFICDKLPLKLLDCEGFQVKNWRRYWSGSLLVDPRQSYVQTMSSGKSNTVVLEFVFADNVRK